MKKEMTSLALSMTLCLSLLTSAFAAETSAIDFSDAAQIEHWEAVASLAELGILNGKDDGAFHPTDTLTRAEGAKLIAVILNGNKNFHAEEMAGAGFSDTQGHWAEPYIAYCSESGIISGLGDGSFDPNGQLTKFQLLKMAEVMLGYDADDFHLNGSYWLAASHSLAMEKGLFADLPEFPTDSGQAVTDEPITREAAAQILYNALCAQVFVGTATYVADDGSVRFEDVYAKRDNGEPETLLHMCFGLDTLPELPAQPTV